MICWFLGPLLARTLLMPDCCHAPRVTTKHTRGNQETRAVDYGDMAHTIRVLDVVRELVPIASEAVILRIMLKSISRLVSMCVGELTPSTRTKCISGYLQTLRYSHRPREHLGPAYTFGPGQLEEVVLIRND